MDCAECQRLTIERERLQRAYETAHAALNAIETSTDSDEYTRLRAAVQEAKLDLDVASIQFSQHQDRHATVI